MKYFLVLTAILFFTCKTEHKSTPKVDLKETIIKNIIPTENKWIITYSNGELSKLATNRESSTFIISPDSTSFIVNSRILSTLQITEYYKLNSDGWIDPETKRNLSSETWDSIAQKYHINKNEIIFPKTNVINWSKENSEILIYAKGETALGLKINEEVKIKLN